MALVFRVQEQLEAIAVDVTIIGMANHRLSLHAMDAKATSTITPSVTWLRFHQTCRQGNTFWDGDGIVKQQHKCGRAALMSH
jgi:hypothetical protein